MFNNIGVKIKGLAVALCALGISLSVIFGMYLIYNRAVGVGIVMLIIGSLLSWISTFVLYGFGQLVHNSDRLVENSEKSLALQQFCKDDLTLITEEMLSNRNNP